MLTLVRRGQEGCGEVECGEHEGKWKGRGGMGLDLAVPIPLRSLLALLHAHLGKGFGVMGGKGHRMDGESYNEVQEGEAGNQGGWGGKGSRVARPCNTNTTTGLKICGDSREIK